MRDIFDEAIGASPPTRIDIDTVIIRRRRIARLRSAGGAAATAVAAVVAAAVVVSLSSASRPKAGPSPSPTGPVTQRPSPPTTCADFWAGSQTAPAHPEDRQCTAGTGPNGQLVLSAVDRLDVNAVRYEVVVLWAGAYVDLTMENYFEGWEGEGDPPAMTYMPNPQLTLERLASLAQDPDLAP